MKIPLPNLDDRRWSDLVDEGRSLIPTYAPDWTDHNVHDPGITVMELLAWIAEMDIYQLNRISDEHKRKFLALIGITSEPPRAAQNVLSFVLKPNVPPRALPAGTQFFTNALSGEQVSFRLLDPVTVVPGHLETVQAKDRDGFHDVTNQLLAGQTISLFGPVPEVGAELYFGFTESLPPNLPVSLHFKFGGERSGADERRRIIEEMVDRERACSPPEISCDDETTETEASTIQETRRLLRNNRVRTSWEFLTNVGADVRWQPLNNVEDDTAAFTLDGRIRLTLPGPMVKKVVGRRESFYLRCRFEAGAYDTPPTLTAVALNGALSEQAVPGWTIINIQKGASILGAVPVPGQQTTLSVQINNDTFTGHSAITQLSFGEPHGAQFTVLAYTAPTDVEAGSITLEGASVGSGDGSPFQEFQLPVFPAQQSSLSLLSLETGSGTLSLNTWVRWSIRQDLDTSKRQDAHFVFDATRGIADFGDGENGRTPPSGALMFATYNATRAEAGNLIGLEKMHFVDGPHNRALFPNLKQIVDDEFDEITNAMSSVAGAPAETLDGAATRAIKLLNETSRAVTLKDYERLALATPGTHLGRVGVLANRHPSFPCLKAFGLITLVILPNMPVPRPTPSFGLLQTVASYLQHKRVIGTRVVVVGPDYLEITVQARVKAFAGVSRGNLQQKIVAALNNFFHPLTGGPDGTGWPFGRDVYRSEVMQLIDQVVGVDNVIELELIADNCGPQCGNICLGPTQLVAGGNHAIEVS